MAAMAEDKPQKDSEPLSLYGMTPEEAIQRAFGATSKADPKCTVLFHRYGLELRADEHDNLILNVLCGRVGQYGVEFQLNLEERNRYKQEGDSYLDELERKVMGDPQSFIKRGRSC
jgi:hypothetical protein